MVHLGSIKAVTGHACPGPVINGYYKVDILLTKASGRLSFTPCPDYMWQLVCHGPNDSAKSKERFKQKQSCKKNKEKRIKDYWNVNIGKQAPKVYLFLEITEVTASMTSNITGPMNTQFQFNSNKKKTFKKISEDAIKNVKFGDK